MGGNGFANRRLLPEICKRRRFARFWSAAPRPGPGAERERICKSPPFAGNLQKAAICKSPPFARWTVTKTEAEAERLMGCTPKNVAVFFPGSRVYQETCKQR